MSLRIPLRRLLRARAFAAAAILVLGLGLGVNLILFNTAYALLWRPLPFPHPDRLVTVTGRSASGDLNPPITGADAATIHALTGVVADSGLTGRHRTVSLFAGEEAIDLISVAADSGYFRTLGVRPLAGHFFGEAEDLGQAAEVTAILTEPAWRAHFGADPGVVGRTFAMQESGSRKPVRIVGIVPATVTLPFASDADLVLPLPSSAARIRTNTGNAFYRAVVRLAAGVRVERASARIDAALRAGSPAWGHNWVEPLRTAVAPPERLRLISLAGSACLLLLLTCANVASLFAARALGRMHETSVHLALGATPLRLIAANFEEALLVSGAGTAVAFLVESWARPLAPEFIPAVKSAGAELLAPGPALVAFGLAIGLVTACVVCAASGVRFHVEGLAALLAQGKRGGSRSRFRAVLAAAQLAIVLALVAVSGMVARSFLTASQVKPGFDPAGVAVFQLSLPGSERATLSWMADLSARLAAIPGVKSVAFAAESPVGGPAFSTVTANHSGALRPSDPMVDYRLVGPAYFETLRARFVAGSAFTAEDVEQGRPIAILNQAAERLLFPRESAMGRMVQPGLGGPRAVAGVVRDMRTESLDAPPVPMVYVPYFPGFGSRFVIRAAAGPAALAPLLRARLGESDPGVLVQRFRTLPELFDESVRHRLVAGAMVSGFALLGLLISAVGLYGTLASAVEQQRREIGIRMALGATARQVARVALAEGLQIAGAGTIAGLALAAVAGRLIRQELYGISPLDVVSLAAAVALLAIVAMAACLAPALRAARLDPVETLNVP